MLLRFIGCAALVVVTLMSLAVTGSAAPTAEPAKPPSFETYLKKLERSERLALVRFGRDHNDIEPYVDRIWKIRPALQKAGLSPTEFARLVRCLLRDTSYCI
jgi:hypothetical protein